MRILLLALALLVGVLLVLGPLRRHASREAGWLGACIRTTASALNVEMCSDR
jgi:hypothetical protein